MNTMIKQRLAALRSWMKKNKFDAFIIPSSDPHQSEYVAPHWQCREWISGFTGSAGTVVVTAREAGLWTDSRYFLQAKKQLDGTGIELFKQGLPDTPSIEEFLNKRFKDGNVGVDRNLFNLDQTNALEKLNACIGSTADPFDEIWADRPPIPATDVFIHELKYAGRSTADKLVEIRAAMKKEKCNSMVVSALDEIAWTLNLRGSDVHCNPVFVSHLIITLRKACLFTDESRLSEEAKKHLKSNHVTIRPYEMFIPNLKKMRNKTWWFDLSRGNAKAHSYLVDVDAFTDFVYLPSPIALMKARRNETEIAGLHAAMQRDGVALAKFLCWLDEAVPQGGQTEMSVSRKLHEFRAEQHLYRGDSFDTIAGYKEHAAIVHYEATPETDKELKSEGFLLLDSGAQYLDGTTDITRTIALGSLTDEEKEDYTLILKGHINLATAVFPEGTRGAQLDALARMPIWKRRMNFLHGTGHGVGHYLNVHEGPQSIRMNENPTPLYIGMLTSNEPGIYKTGSHGIRTENLMLTIDAGEGMFGRYFKFETVTLCPICKKGIIRELLTDEEASWLNAYHRDVYLALAPHLSDKEQLWLKEACSEI